MRQNQRRPSHPRDDVGHGEGLARAGDPQEHLVLQPALNAGHKAVYRLRLIAPRLKRADKAEFGLFRVG